MEIQGYFRIEIKDMSGAYEVLTRPEAGILILDENNRVIDMRLDRDGADLDEVNKRNSETERCTGRITFQESPHAVKIFDIEHGAIYPVN